MAENPLANHLSWSNKLHLSIIPIQPFNNRLQLHLIHLLQHTFHSTWSIPVNSITRRRANVLRSHLSLLNTYYVRNDTIIAWNVAKWTNVANNNFFLLFSLHFQYEVQTYTFFLFLFIPLTCKITQEMDHPLTSDIVILFFFCCSVTYKCNNRSSTCDVTIILRAKRKCVCRLVVGVVGRDVHWIFK